MHGYYEVRDQPLGVLGGSPESVDHAVLARLWSSDVVFFPDTHHLTPHERERLLARPVEVVEGLGKRVVVEEDEVCGIEMADGTVVRRAAVFVRPRLVPNADLLVGLGWRRGRRRMGRDRCRRPDQRAGGVGRGKRSQPTGAGHHRGRRRVCGRLALNADLVEEDVEERVRRHRRPRA